MSASSPIDRARWEALTDALATDETLSPDDRAFVDAYDDVDADDERALYSALQQQGQPGAVDPGDRARAMVALAQRADHGRSAAWRRAAAGFGLAAVAAAAVVVFVSRVPVSTLAERAGGGAVVTSGTLMLDGVALGQGDALPVDRWVVARAQSCVRVATGGNGCVAKATRLRLADDRLELAEGTLHFAGTGTIASASHAIDVEDADVELTVAAGRASLQAQSGTVVLRDADGQPHPLSTGVRHTLDPVPLADDGRVATVAALQGEALDDEALDDEALDDEALDDEAPVVPASRRPAASSTPRVPPGALLSAARGHVADGRVELALASYATLRRQYPQSSEAHAANVSVGQLELQRGRPKAALRAFARYLQGGGPLAEEAHWGKIRALDRLGRKAERDAAIKALRAASPGSVYLGRAAGL